MILIWKGFGILVPLAILLGSVISNSIFNIDNSISNAMVFVFGAFFCYIFDFLVRKYREKNCEYTTLVDPITGKEKSFFFKQYMDSKTGETHNLILKDTFFGLSMFIWVLISLLIAAFAYFSN